MRGLSRRGALTVKDGRVQKKNNWEETRGYDITPQAEPVIDRQRPGAGYRHVLMQRDVEKFIAILPDWKEMSEGLNGIVLAPGRANFWGYHRTGVIYLCAWHEEMEIAMATEYFNRDQATLEKIGVPCESIEGGSLALFTPNTARAFLLLDVFLHELGHHHDAITNSSKRVVRGEPYAEAYARKYGDLVWERFTRHFALD